MTRKDISAVDRALGSIIAYTVIGIVILGTLFAAAALLITGINWLTSR